MTNSGRFIAEPARETPVLAETDVLIAGGGVSGCAAAVSAARVGARTILIERNGFLGGVASASMMANIGNRFLTGNGNRAICGFAGELVSRLVGEGAASPKWEHRDVPGCTMDSERLKVILIDMLREAGVTVLTHCLAATPIMEDHAVIGVSVESKSGRQAVLAKEMVDGSVEADIAYRAGAETTWDGGTASILFKMMQVDLDEFVEFLFRDPDGFPGGMDWVKDLDTFARNWRERGVFFFPHGGGTRWRFFQDTISKAAFKTRRPPAMGLDALGMYGFRGNDWVVVNSNFYE